MACNDKAIELDIVSWAGEGCGVGRLPNGKAVFVDQALPGERVLARLTKEKKTCAWAKLEQVINPAPARVEASCPHYQSCGGCVLQHMDYQTQLAYKQDQVAQALRRIGKLSVEVPAVLAAAQPWGYRNRVVFHVQHEPELRFGLYQEKSRQLSPADCPLLRQPLRELAELLSDILPVYAKKLQDLRELALRCDAGGERLLLTLVAEQPLAVAEELALALSQREPRLVSIWENSGSAVYSVYGTQWRRILGEEFLLDRLSGVELELAPAAFLQVNHEQAEQLYSLVRQYLGDLSGQTLLDVYCGVGSIGLSLAKEARRLIGVESYAPSIAAAKRNAERNELRNVKFLCGTAEQVLPQMAAQGMAADKLVLDPPRAGCEKAALAAIAQLAPGCIVYVSCDPATLARDLAFLSEQGYQVERVQPVDMFPQTGHVETVCLLVLRNPVTHVNIDVDVEELVQDKRGQATYPQIKEYVLEQTGLKVSSLYISQIKRKCGLDVGDSYNKPKSEDARVPQCPPEKEKAIMDALRHFGITN